MSLLTPCVARRWLCWRSLLRTTRVATVLVCHDGRGRGEAQLRLARSPARTVAGRRSRPHRASPGVQRGSITWPRTTTELMRVVLRMSWSGAAASRIRRRRCRARSCRGRGRRRRGAARGWRSAAPACSAGRRGTGGDKRGILTRNGASTPGRPDEPDEPGAPRRPARCCHDCGARAEPQL